jgi:hypothetical protein
MDIERLHQIIRIHSSLTIARAITFALKAGVQLHRDRLVMASYVAAIMPPSGRKATYPTYSDF